jgi:acetolactate synthase I/II/III large subunit
MKFATAALWLVLTTSAPTSQAFIPNGITSSSSSRYTSQRAAFISTSSAPIAASSRNSQRVPWYLKSTTEDTVTTTSTSEAIGVESIDVRAEEKEANGVIIEESPITEEIAPTAETEATWTVLDHSTVDAARANAVSYLQQFLGQNGASIIYSKLQENDVTVVNGFSGGAVLPLLDQFHEGHPRHKEPNAPKPIRWITNSNENSSGHIAEGYAKSMPYNPASLPVGVVVATSGPGVTNLITPLQDAICDGVPMVVLCGQAATVAPKDAFQACPAVDLTKPCTKWSYQIRNAAELPMVMDYAFFIARNGRPGPVFVDLPKDLQNQVVTEELIQKFVQQNLNEASDSNFVKVQEQERMSGEAVHAFSIGYNENPLPFEVAMDIATSKYKMAPIRNLSSKAMNDYYADHHPTNKVYYRTVEGKNQDGTLEVDSVMTKQMLSLISKAKKPVIIAGQGCNECPNELKVFAEKLRIPVATTLHALGCFDERNELALNMLGMHGHPTPNFMVQQSDLIICIGSRFDDRITGRIADFLPQARRAAEEGRGGIIHVDIRLTENAKQVKPTFFVHSTAKTFLDTMNDIIKDSKARPTTDAWLSSMRDLQRDFPIKIPKFPTVEIPVPSGTNGADKVIYKTRMSAQSVVAAMNRQLLDANVMDDCIFTTGVGIHQMVAAQLITWTQPRQMLSSGSLGTMGVSLGYCIGAKLANGKKIVISVDGDGSFNMTFTELKTLAEQKIAVKILLLDNDGQMMVEYWQRLFHDNRLIAVRNSNNPDYVMLARSFGIKAIHCDHEEDLEAKMKEFLFADPDEPVLFHVQIERTPCLPLVAPGQPLEDMILEDIDVEVDQSAAPS